jgi:hypothetical protein
MKQQFYIGYLEKAPKPIAHFLKRVLPVIVLLGLICGAVISTTQTGFNEGKYELGKRTQFTGFVEKGPIPMLRIENPGKGNDDQVLLIGFGKFGADTTLAEMEKYHEMTFADQLVTLEGTQILMGDMRLLELTEKKFSLIHWKPGQPKTKLNKKPLGHVGYSGEVIDPKCYFGVMKPGEGKTHRSCAILCINGGIPPMLKTTDDDGVSSYIFLLGENETPQQSEWAPFAGLKNTRVAGDAYDWNGWQVLLAGE